MGLIDRNNIDKIKLELIQNKKQQTKKFIYEMTFFWSRYCIRTVVTFVFLDQLHFVLNNFDQL